MYGADLGALFNNERRAALWARLGNRHEWRGEIAIRITRAAIENTRTAPAPFASAAAAHEFAFGALRAFNAHGDRPRVLALPIAGGDDEFAKSAVLFHKMIAAQRAGFGERLSGLARDAGGMAHPPSSLTVGVTLAGGESADHPPVDHLFLAAFVEIPVFRLTASVFGNRGQ